MSRYMVVDTETTGLDHNIHGIITLSAIVFEDTEIVSGWNGVNKDWSSKFKIDLSALKVNGFKIDRPNTYFGNIFEFNNKVNYVNFINYQGFVYNFADYMLSECPNIDYMVGMNLQFDLGFISKAMTDYDININGFLPRKHIDPRIIACALQDCNNLPKPMKYINSESLYEAYQIEAPKALHASDTDVYMTHKLWLEMKKTFSVKA